MNQIPYRALLFISLGAIPAVLVASPRTGLPVTAYDGGPMSAETLGRGDTNASGTSSLGAAGSSPAGLSGAEDSSIYTTLFVGETSKLSHLAVKSADPVSQKIMQNLAMGSNKGVLYYEALGRQDNDETISLETSSAVRHVDFAADALGFAAAEKWGEGSMGISVAYLTANMGEIITSTSTTQSSFDRGYGARLNVSLRQPTGPFMWGLQLQNFPGFLWWNHHRRDQLPMRVRIGNTWRVSPGVLFSIDTEKRYYAEGSDKKNYIYIGNETALSDQLTLRLGVFSNDIGQPSERHWTGGLSCKLGSGVNLTYALESFNEFDQNVKQSFLSVQVPLSTDSTK